ncbi:MAG: efflux transporter periplasmic adaptor subunit [Chromatiales bacterium 21-64-14]|nr:MAG: efflux transporter periplasmic adaptor subunit [Chromatiales bacterium 21-64-14]HQU17091.1 efflux RND transporter periplasmic adaptor subunit [Gammaproteobacteria bacterium]
MSRSTLFAATLALAVGAGGGYWLATRHTAPHTGGDAPGAPAPAATGQTPKVLYYRNPMNPAVTSRVPTKDSMGMDYIPAYQDRGAGATAAAPGTVTIDPVMVQDMGVRTARAERRSLSRVIRTVGQVAVDERRVVRVHPKSEGWVRQVTVATTGQPVRRGQVLLRLYAPQIVSTEQEYLLALRQNARLGASPYPDIRSGARELVRSARQRLALLDVPAAEIRALVRRGSVLDSVPLDAPAGGIALRVGVREGQYVTPRTELYQIADLSRIWVYANLYDYELPWVQVGDPAKLTLAALPGVTLKGRITYLYPYADNPTRTVRARMEFENPDLALRPDLYADVRIHASRQVDAVVIPSAAVLNTGTRKLVFVQRAPGRFEPRDVVTGVSSDGRVQILKGIAAGETVVTSGQFLIDSESNLREAAANLMKPAQTGTGGESARTGTTPAQTPAEAQP